MIRSTVIETATEDYVRTARAKGTGIKRIARDLGVGVSVVQRVTQEA